jgi:ABC-type transport system substrate-binding protein
MAACGAPDERAETGSSVSMTNAVGKAMPPDAAPADQQVLRQAINEPSTLDVGIALFKAQFIAFLFEQLVVFDDNLELRPAAAASWSVGPDRKTWTFTMRPGGRWSDGRPVTAHDFEWSFRRLLDPSSGNVFAYFYYPIKGARAFNTGQTADPATLGVKAVDEHTLVIETEEPCSHFPYICAFFTSVPAPRWQVEKFGPRWTDPGNCVSNSTWMLDTWNKGRDMTFILNPHYDGPFKGYLEKLHFKFVEAGWRGLTAYENDEFDRIGIDGPDFLRAKEDPVLSGELVTFPNFGTYYTIFQTTKPPFDNVKLRQAIAHAIDREAICGVVMSGTATPAYGMLPKGFPGYQVDRIRPHQAFDPALARRLLAEAGYPDGRGLPRLELWVRGSPPTPLEQQAVVAIQQMMKDHLGLVVDLRNMTTNVFNDYMVRHDIPWGFLWFNMDYPDPSDMIAVPWRSQPAGAGRQDWKNEAFDRLVDAAAQEFDEARRVAMYQEAEEILAREAAGVFLFNLVNAGLNKPWVRGIEMNKYGDRRWSGLTPSYAALYIGQHEALKQRAVN